MLLMLREPQHGEEGVGREGLGDGGWGLEGRRKGRGWGLRAGLQIRPNTGGGESAGWKSRKTDSIISAPKKIYIISLGKSKTITNSCGILRVASVCYRFLYADSMHNLVTRIRKKEN